MTTLMIAGGSFHPASVAAVVADPFTVGASLKEFTNQYINDNPRSRQQLLDALGTFATTYGDYPDAVPIWMNMGEPSGVAPWGRDFPGRELLAGIHDAGATIVNGVSQHNGATPVVHWETVGNITLPDSTQVNMATWTNWFNGSDPYSPHNPSAAAKIYLDQLIADAQSWKTYADAHGYDPNIIVRLDQEMNYGPDSEHGLAFAKNHNGNTVAANFVEMWRTIHKYVRGVNNGNCTFLHFLWAPFANANLDPGTGLNNPSFDAFWPGQGWVEYMGFDIYAQDAGTQWGQSPYSLYKNPLNKLYNLESPQTHNKPIVVAETGINQNESPHPVPFTDADIVNWFDGSGFNFHGLQDPKSFDDVVTETTDHGFSQIVGIHYFNIDMWDQAQGPNWEVRFRAHHRVPRPPARLVEWSIPVLKSTIGARRVRCGARHLTSPNATQRSPTLIAHAWPEQASDCPGNSTQWKTR